jgi:site-specific DNA-methyltransferase (adenine-specific)
MFLPLNEIITGDAFQVLSELPANSIDAVITDPPYGTTDIEWDKAIDLDCFWEGVNRVVKPDGVVVVYSSQPFTTDVINSNRKDFRYEIIWEKTIASGFLNAKKRPLKAHENILVFSRKPSRATYNPQKTEGKPYKSAGSKRRSQHYKAVPRSASINTGDRYPRSVLKFPTVQKVGHPTSKPVDLMKWLVNTYSHPGELILDPFMGSGSTALACSELGRRYIGVEQNPEYVELANKRLGVVT